MPDYVGNYQKGLEEAKKVEGLIRKTDLSDEDKETIVSDSVHNFNNHINAGWLEYRKSVSTDYAFVEWYDSEETFSDVYGREFIDLLGGFGIYNIGHRNKEVVETVKSQIDRYALHSQELVDPLKGYLAKIVSMITPGDLRYAFFTNGGAEAVEIACKLARLASKKKWFISTVDGYHGVSMGALSMTGRESHRQPYLPLVQDVRHVEYGNAEAVRKAIQELKDVGEEVAGVIVEPIQGEGGVNVPPDDYLPKLREICDEYRANLIVDEIQTGMGRTGKMWAVEHWDVVPDILCYGKAFGGGVMPITGIAARPHLWCEEIQENPLLLGSPTFGGNPLCCSGAIAGIRYTLDNDIPKQAAEKGEYFLGKLKELQKKHKIIVDARGKGLLMALEYPSDKIGYAVSKGMFDKNVLVAGTLNKAKVFRVEPPLIISKETIDEVVEKFDQTLTEVEEQFGY